MKKIGSNYSLNKIKCDQIKYLCSKRLFEMHKKKKNK